MSSENKNINYTAKDIEQYLAGKLSPLQMHAMEKAALDDLFLAEAMEGFEGMKDNEWNAQLVLLREEIANKGSIAKVIPLHKTKNNWWKTVAAILILGAGTLLTFILTKDKPEENYHPQIAQTITAAIDSSSQTGNEAPVPVTETLNPSASVASKEELKDVIAKVDKKIPGDRSEDHAVSEPAAVMEKVSDQHEITLKKDIEKPKISVLPANNIPAPVINSDENKTSISAGATIDRKNKAVLKQNNDAEVLNRQKNQGFSNAKKDQALNNFFTAQVVSTDNAPLPFTNISIKKDNFGTYADIKGMVRLVSSDSLLNIEVRSVGYLPRSFSLRSGQLQTKIVLKEDEEAMKEQTIVINKENNSSYRSRRATLVTDTAVNVEPADGWENYNTYVANNLEIPESMLKNDFHGEVELSFDVKSNGTISNIRINKSLGAEYDEAAKRLILDGPQWKVKKGKINSASVKVKF